MKTEKPLSEREYNMMMVTGEIEHDFEVFDSVDVKESISNFIEELKKDVKIDIVSSLDYEDVVKRIDTLKEKHFGDLK